MKRPRLLALCAASAAIFASAASGQTVAVEPLADNSFLIEEAYNQGPGVVQHIALWSRERGGGWALSVTDEWPVFDEKNQLSLSLSAVDSDGAGGTRFGDTLLNYRRAIDLGDERLAFAPRLSLLLPTGDVDDGTGLGAIGAQFNLPLSFEASDAWVTHTNVGATWVPGAEVPLAAGGDTEFDLSAVSLGQSLVWRVAPRFNPLLEVVWTREEMDFGRFRETTSEGFVALGFRWGHDFSSGLQIVPGIAYARGFDDADGDEQWLLYLSFEHPFGR
jgi:hypothetical protein